MSEILCGINLKLIEAEKKVITAVERIAMKIRNTLLEKNLSYMKKNYTNQAVTQLDILEIQSPNEEGMGVVEVILIIVVLIGLVIIFQDNIKGIVASIFGTIEKNAGKIK